MDRKTFVKTGIATLAGLTVIPRHVLGRGYLPPSDKITLAFIGTGKQARGLAGRFARPECQILAGCDVDQEKLHLFQSHVLTVTEEKLSRAHECDLYRDYQQLLVRRDIDAVVIATPDHWHAIMCVDALKAGKDVFCEKPLAHTVEEGRRIAQVARKYKGILQTGSMQRSSFRFRQAVNLVRNGYLGEIRRVDVSVGDPPIDCDLEPEHTPEMLDWDRWLGPAPIRAYHSKIAPPVEVDVWAGWRQYSEYGGGGVTDWGAHMFDIVQWALDKDTSGPVLFMPPAEPGAKRGMKMVYDEGIEVNHVDFGRGNAIRFYGSEGTLDVSRSFLDSDPGTIAETELAPNAKLVYHSDDHYDDWLQAIKTRSQPICNAETGHRTSSVCNIANITYRLRRPLRWDPKKERFVKSKQADAFLNKEYRSPYRFW